ncbi:hypothetical protein HY041_03955 [Candidatus Roizmanbacteria bacterium]|nr:hypothetical protein [Candidatus Roizmanbacteria bacterium]
MADKGTNEFGIRIRRKWIPIIIAAALGLAALPGCGPAVATFPVSPTRPPIEQPVLLTESPELMRMKEIIEKGYAMRTVEDTRMLEETYPGIDLKYSGNQTVAKIRAISDPIERFLTAIAFLDVEKSGRYNKYPEIYECNIYTLDLLRLLLGNDVIGSRYSLKDGTVDVAGLDEIARMRKNGTWSVFDKNNPSFDSNMLDKWMREVGSKKYGWRQVRTQNEFTQGTVVLGVTKWELIQSKKVTIGHAFVAIPLLNNSMGISQASTNILIQVVPYGNSKVDPMGDYDFWYQPKDSLASQNSR